MSLSLGVLPAWRRFGNQYIAIANERDDAVLGVTVGEVIRDASALANLVHVRADYLLKLVEAGVLRESEQVPDDDLLWEIYPTDLRVEIDNR